MNVAHGSGAGTPVVTEMHVIPVAGQDSMLLNLCGAHAPYFTRNLVILKDSSGHTGIGEVPGGEGIRQALDRSRELVIGKGYKTREEAKQDVFKYIELYYNRQRMHSSIGYNAPCDLERDVA